MNEKREIYRAIAELAYIMAKSHEGLHNSEKDAFFRVIEHELEYQSWVAQSRFELLDEVTKPTITKAYHHAMHVLNTNKNAFDDTERQKAIKVLEEIAEAHKGKHEVEEFVIDRFKKDTADLL